MRKSFGLAVLALVLPVLAGAFELPRIAFGPYIGAYLMDCSTINNNVLCVDGDPSLGPAPLFGADFKVYLPKRYFSEISLGYSPQKTETGPFSAPISHGSSIDTINTTGELTIVPLAVTLGRDFQLMPKLWGSAGLSAGYTFATLAIDTSARYLDNHLYSSHSLSRGGGPFVGFRFGIDLKIPGNISLSINLGYRYGNIKRLTIGESSDPVRIGSTLKYYDHSSGTEKDLPLEISNAILCYGVKLSF
jgi:hypothetical protein